MLYEIGYGQGALIRTEATLPDSTCPLAGVLVYAGIDVDRDGVPGDDEIDLANPTEHLCSSGAVDPFEGAVFLAPTTGDNLALYKADARGGEPVKLAATTDAASSLGNVVGTSDPFYFPNTFKASPDGAETTNDELYVTPAGEAAQARRVGTFPGSVVESVWP